MSQKTMLTQFAPDDFYTDRHYFNTFGNSETEVSANWLVQFLRHRGKGWADFMVGEIEDYFDQQDKTFTFNRLLPGEHLYVSPRGNSFQPNEHTIEIKPSRKDGKLKNGDVCTITEKFVLNLVNGGVHLPKG